jgi:predicted transcriptional regulator
MARTSWFDERAEHPVIQEQINKLESFTKAMSDGVVEKRELEAQEQRLTAAMKRLEPELSDELHAKVTTTLVELTAYNVMRLLHELHAERARMAFGKP